MTTLSGVNRYFQLKQIESIILQAEENVKSMIPQIGCDRETGLKEFRILAHLTGRQTGSTERIVRLFNPATDIYVGVNGTEVEGTIENIRNINGDKKLKVRYLNMNSKNLKNQIDNMRGQDLKRVWFDCGGNGLYSRSTVINCIIRNLEIAFDPLTPVYIIC
jgi:hypothetical protein